MRSNLKPWALKSTPQARLTAKDRAKSMGKRVGAQDCCKVSQLVRTCVSQRSFAEGVWATVSDKLQQGTAQQLVSYLTEDFLKRRQQRSRLKPVRSIQLTCAHEPRTDLYLHLTGAMCTLAQNRR